MTKSQVPLPAAKELYSFGINLRRKIILDLVLISITIIISVIGLIALYNIPTDPYALEEWIEQIIYFPVLPVLFGFFTIGMSGLSITSLIFTILMLIAISRAKDLYSHPDLQKTSLMLLIGFVLTLLGIEIVGLILQLIGWDAFKKFIAFTDSSGSGQSQADILRRNIRNYIISSICLAVALRVITLIIIYPLMRFYMELITGSIYPIDPLVFITELLPMFGILRIVLPISVVLSAIPMVFSLKIANGLCSQFQYAQNYLNVGISHSSYSPSQSYHSVNSAETLSTTMRYCTKCGAKNPKEAQFCASCGEKF